jgi:hypothetical protein
MSTTATAVKPTLRNTLLSKHLPGFTYVRETFYERLVKPSGYPFFEWGDRVYGLANGHYEDTGVLYVDLT